MPRPKKGEKKDDFISRCIPEVMEEGVEQSQAAAMCNAYWENRSKGKRKVLTDKALRKLK